MTLPFPILIAAVPLAAGAPAEAPGGSEPGVVLIIEPALSGTGAGEPRRDARLSRLLALHVEADASPSPFLEPGPFRARWEGFLQVDLRDDHTFFAEGRGSLRLRINGEVALEASGEDLSRAAPETLELRKGLNEIVLEYWSPGAGQGAPVGGPAAVRLSWRTPEVPRAPVPAAVLRHDPRHPVLGPLLERMRFLRDGREALASRRCLRCHHRDSLKELSAKGPPELAMDAPDLSGAGSRLREAWMARWVLDPGSLHPEAAMPRVFSGEDAEGRSRDAAAYLAGLREEPRAPGADGSELERDASLAARGGILYLELGCLACHTLEPASGAVLPRGNDSRTRLSLAGAAGKWMPLALVDYLLEPGRGYAWTAMPDFGLSREEARALAAFILQRGERAAGGGAASARGDAARGRQLVQSSGCLDCHALKEPAGAVESLAAAPPALLALAGGGAFARGAFAGGGAASPSSTAGGGGAPVSRRGCLAEDGAGGRAPRFRFREREREALEAFLGSGPASLRRRSAPELAARQVRLLRCGACHSRDGEPDLWSTLDAESEALRRSLGAAPVPPGEAAPQGATPGSAAPGSAGPGGAAERALDQTRPHLTWTGEKLRPEWMELFLEGGAGRGDGRGAARIPPGTIGSGRLRPWLAARMPAFPGRGALLARGLAEEHGYPGRSEPEGPPDAELARMGRRLLGKAGGFGCVSCHDVGSVPAQGAFEVKGVNFIYSRERLRKDFFHRWMLNPVGISPETRMPQFADVEGRSPLVDVFGGDARRQFEAIWHCLQAGRALEPPE